MSEHDKKSWVLIVTFLALVIAVVLIGRHPSTIGQIAQAVMVIVGVFVFIESGLHLGEY